ncbi:MAG TPA: glycosyltransferase family 4 protein [Acidimicrobiales bacterium]|nr:glycosyltransferase family 4 protein [Acidimicrobiales bacterium]
MELVDLEPDASRRLRTALKVAQLRWSPNGSGVTSPWRWSRTWSRITQRDVARAAEREQVDAVLQIGDLAIIDAPSWVYQDLTYASLLPFFGRSKHATGPLQPGLTRQVLERKVAEQREFYEHAAGAFAMSEWLATQLVREVPCPVTVVYPGRNTEPPPASSADDERRATRPRRLLSIGVDFYRKGIDLVADAVSVLRSRGMDVELTIAGPTAWPDGRPMAPGVTFLGSVPPAAVPNLYAAHDVFVLPSRFEPFGIVFTEALAAGLPVVARDAFAMPEIVRPAENGALVPTDCEDAAVVADGIEAVISDLAMFERVAAARASAASTFSWGSAAARMRSVMVDALGT